MLVRGPMRVPLFCFRNKGIEKTCQMLYNN